MPDAPVNMAVSICVCTRNRTQELARALDSIAASTTPPDRVVVSDDSDQEATRRMVSERYSDVTYVEGPRRGLGANRNRAVAAATGDHVLFLDDDAVLGEDFLGRVCECLSRLPANRRRSTIVTGVERQQGREIAPRDQGILGFQSRPYRDGQALRTVVINATVFPRAMFDELKFDPQLVYGYDEVDLTTQAVARGFDIVPCFQAVNDHLPSAISRDEYLPFTNASRLYVTLKRRRWTEGSRLRGWAGFWLAALHTCGAAVKQNGLAGVGEGWRTIVQAWRYYANFVAAGGTDRMGVADV